MDYVLAAVVVAILEPVFVLVVAPRITRHFVKKDVDQIVAEKVAPHINAAVTAATQPMLDALKHAAEVAQEMHDDTGRSAGQELGRRSVDSRNDFAMREEAFEAALFEKAGALGPIIAEEAKARFRNHWKSFVRQGPDAVPQLMELAEKLGVKSGQRSGATAVLNL